MKLDEFMHQKLLPNNLINNNNNLSIEGPEDDKLINVIGVQIELTGKIFDYLPNNVKLRYGDYCIIEMDKGIEIGKIYRPPFSISKKQYRKPLKKVIRKATPEDMEQKRRNIEKGHKGLLVCQKRIAERGLPMKLVKVRYSFDGTKAIFYFTAEGRIDFRDLVKDLAGRFKTRIEMRQIGVRDEARLIKGYGCCGRPLCCSLFLHVCQRNVTPMLKYKLHRRALSRLVAGLFTVQLFAAGFCLMMPQAHAMPMVKAVHSMSDSMVNAEHCKQPMEAQVGQDAEHSPYTHCDQLDSFLQNVSAPIQPDFDIHPDLLAAPEVSDWVSQTVSLFSRTPTGPPRSSSLLYRISPRILV